MKRWLINYALDLIIAKYKFQARCCNVTGVEMVKKAGELKKLYNEDCK